MTRSSRFIHLTLATALALVFSGFVHAEDSEVSNSGLSSELFYQLLIGEISAQNGDAPAAYALMLDAARKANAPRLYERAVELALRARSADSALQAAQAWARAFPASADANRYVLQILVGLNRIPETLEPIKRQIAALKDQDRAAAIALLPRYFVRTTTPKQAVIVLEQALAGEIGSKQFGPISWTSIGRMRLLAGDAPGAWEAARRGSALNPLAEDPVLLALELMTPENPGAEAIVREFLAHNPPLEVRMAYARKLLDNQRFAESLVQMQQLTQEKPDYADAWLVRGSLEFQEKKWDASRASLNAYVALNPQQDKTETEAEMGRGLVQAYFLLSQIAEEKADFEGAKAYLQRIESTQDAFRVQARLAMILARQGKLDEARQLIRAYPESQPDDARTKLNAEVQLLRDNKQFPAAYQLLGEAMTRFPQDTDLAYDQAMMAEKLNKLGEMEQLLRLVISAKPDYHHAYNALGYSLADRKQRLPEARQLVAKALEFAPNDPFIVDSMAWVEYRSGNGAEALKLLQKAFTARPDAEIAAHLGEVLWSLGQHDKANGIWKEGIALNPDNETLLETMRRFRTSP
jgi:tetratricopeptide (TPR) repeat protein